MTRFNFKSQICTTREQSERLLALGLKRETADMSHTIQVVLDKTFDLISEDVWKEDYPASQFHFPAWSLHRLIEMMPEEIDRYFCKSFLNFSKHNVYYNESVDGAPDVEFEKNNLYDNIIDCIEWLIKEGYLNKEYLCEK